MDRWLSRWRGTPLGFALGLPAATLGVALLLFAIGPVTMQNWRLIGALASQFPEPGLGWLLLGTALPVVVVVGPLLALAAGIVAPILDLWTLVIGWWLMTRGLDLTYPSAPVVGERWRQRHTEIQRLADEPADAEP